uniref:HD/PDEase domain-containing protein n=1 Tax=Graphocephala atropunctata TaxID=36148 RepID=A0A1B6MIH2_9HEMI
MNGFSCNENGYQSSERNLAMEALGYKVFNDSVHGHITLHPLLVKVVDTPEFQRLRNIKQLGFAYYVFPGASHCRYEHSLGTCYLAGQMVEKLLSREQQQRTSEEKKKITLYVQLAALCHDLGHGPFSHTWEVVTKMWNKSESWKHENASIEMLDHMLKNKNLLEEFKKYNLEEKEIKIIKQLIMGGPDIMKNEKPLLNSNNNFLYEIVSNADTGVDVDKWDYFLRDGLHLNLRITFDYHRLLEFCRVMYTTDKMTHIAFRDKEMLNLYDMYRVRSTLHYTAYRHRVVLNIELMCVDAFKAAGDAGYKINNSDIELRKAHQNAASLSQLTDHVFYDILYSSDENLAEARKLIQRVLKRDLYKLVETVNIPVDETTSRKQKQNEIDSKKSRLLEELKESYGEEIKFGVVDFYLNLDSTSDPVRNVKFYKKTGPTEPILSQGIEEIQKLLDPLPFQLVKDVNAQLLVFCKTPIDEKEKELEKAREIIRNFK